MAELGVGDLARRRDEAWAMTVLVDAFDESIPAGPADDELAGREVLADLLQRGSSPASWSRAIVTFCSTLRTRPNRSTRRGAAVGVG